MLVSVLAVLVLIVGLVGTVYPILPGSLLNVVVSVTWAWILGSTASWTFGLVAAGLSIAGVSASAAATGWAWGTRWPRSAAASGACAGPP